MNKKKLATYIDTFIQNFQLRERISDLDVYRSLQPRETLVYSGVLPQKEVDRLLELRSTFLDAVSDGVRELGDGDDRELLKETFGTMPQMELGQLIDDVFAQCSQRAKERVDAYETSEQRKARYYAELLRGRLRSK